MSPTALSGTFGDKPNGTAIDKSTFAPQPTGKLVHEWERKPVASKAPRLQGKKVWKKLMRAFGATDSDSQLHAAQAELETAGAGGRKKMRMTSTKTNIRDAEWKGAEWHGFQDDVAMGLDMKVDENQGDKTARKRRKVGSEDKIITPRKPLRQMALDTEAGEKVEDVLDDEVTIAKRARKAMRKSGSRQSLLSSEVTTVSDSLPQSGAMPTDPFMDNTPTEPRSALSIYASTSNLSPNKRKLMRAKFAQQSTASPREPRRLSGALFADAASPNTPPNINFGTSTASPMQFGASRRLQNSTPLGTPVRGASTLRTSCVPGTAPAKLHSKQTRTEIEQEMASFFTPIPRLKKVKRRSSPIKSYLQQLLENKEEVIKLAQDAQDERAPTPERDSALSFARDVPGSPASPVASETAISPVELPIVEKNEPTAEEDENTAQEDTSMTEDETPVEEDEPTVNQHESSASEDKLQVHAKLDAVASAVRLDFESVPDLSIERLGSFANSQSEESYLDDDTEEDVSLIRNEHEEAIISEEEEEDFDPEEQLRLELAASQETASEASDSEELDEIANVETPDDEDADELMLDPPASISSIAEVANSTPAFISSIEIVAEPISHTPTSEESAIASDSSDSNSNDPSNSTSNVSFEDEETAMLLAFVTKNQAKKLSRSASVVSPKGKTSPLRAVLGDVTGNGSLPLAKKTTKSGKVEKDAPASPTKKSRRLHPDTAIDATDILTANEVTEPSSVRRSGRTASKPTASKIPAPPSFIPVRHLGADGTEVKAPKKEKTIEQITKLNTGKNKAGCLQPMVVLKRLKMEEKMSSKSTKPGSPAKAASPMKAGKSGAKEKKKLVWAEELTMVREFDEKSIVRPVEKVKADGKKEKAEGKKLEDTKKTRVRVGTASERASKVALGMVANGTPAKRKSKDLTSAEKDKKETPAKRVRQPKLRSPKVRGVKAMEKKNEDVVMC